MSIGGTFQRAAVGASVLAVLSATGYAGASPQHASPAAHHPLTIAVAKARSGSSGATTDLRAVAAVPGTSYAYVIQARGFGAANDKFSVMRLQNGHLRKVWASKLGGRYGNLGAIVAVSKRHVYLGGATQVAHTTEDVPRIFRLVGKKFLPMKLPATAPGAVGVGSMAASSPTNVWAVGGIYLGTNTGGPQALRFTGTKWAFTDTPQDTYYSGQSDVSTSAATNTWAIRGDGNLLSWSGSTWTDLGPAPVASPGHIATSSRHLVYVSGTDKSGKRAIMKSNGKKWSKATIKGVPSTALITDLTLVGKQGWAVAQWGNAKGYTVSAILHTSGGAWTRQYVTHGKGPTYIYAISASSSKHAFAVGTHYPDFHTSGHAMTFTLHGHKWKVGK